ncbi:MAG: c-type cytochrome biogenesis protein CcmI [Burkholderiales bacterium]
MSGFAMVAVVLTAIALAVLLRPLLSRRSHPGDVERAAANLAILRDQVAELDADLRAGTLSEAQHREAKAELERRVLEEVKAEHTASAAGPAPRSGRLTAVAVALLVPVAAAALYWRLGSHDGFDPEKLAARADADGGGDRHAISQQQLEQMVDRLVQKLAEKPDDPEGWSILARSYFVLQRFPDAAKAYEKVLQLAPGNADVLVDYADALAMSQGRDLAGKPIALVREALKIDPDNLKALAMAGTDAFNRKDYKDAVRYWERLEKGLPAESPFADSVKSNLAEARELAGVKAPVASAAPRSLAAAPGPVAVKGTVTLAPGVAAKAAPGDTVFIFARAATGPRMPLAILKKQVKDLPATFTLDDSMAMSPDLKLSRFGEVVVGARVSKSANAAPQSGDLEGLSRPVKPGAEVAVVIDKVLP